MVVAFVGCLLAFLLVVSAHSTERQQSQQLAASDIIGAAHPPIVVLPPPIGPSVEAGEAAAAQWALEHPRSSLVQRLLSRTAYRGLDRGQARALAEAHFPELFTLWRNQDDFGFEPDELVDYRGDFAAVLDRGPGEPRSLLSSGQPIRATEPGQGKQPIDLDLVASGGGFVPGNAATDTAMPLDLRDGVEIDGDQLTLGVRASQHPSAAVTSSHSEAVFYSEIETDTDLLVAPGAAGLQFVLQIRSSRSPKEIVLPVELPNGAVLRQRDETGGARIVGANGSDYEITPPLAFDSDSRPVHSSLRVRGQSLVLEVAHRDGSNAYPIIVDPSITYAFASGYDGWRYAENFNAYRSNYGSNVLFAIADPSTSPPYPESSTGHWSIEVPYRDHSSAWFRYAEYGALAYARGPDTPPYPGVRIAIIAPDALGSPYYYASAPTYIFTTPFPNTDLRLPESPGLLPSHPPGQSSAYNPDQIMFGLQVPIGATGALGGSPSERYVYLHHLITEMADGEVPSVNLRQPLPAGDAPEGWFEGQGNYNLTVQGSDGGLGVLRLAYAIGAQSQLSGTHTFPFPEPLTGGPCTSRNELEACPQDAEFSFPYSPSTLVEGIHPIVAQATDALLGISPGSGQMERKLRIDRSPPALSPGPGSLALGGTNGLDFQVTATDGNPSVGAPDSARRSGVRSLELFLDGSPVRGPDPQPCNVPLQGGCSRTLDYTLDPYLSSDETVLFKAIATDQLADQPNNQFSHMIERSWEASFPLSPTLDIDRAVCVQIDDDPLAPAGPATEGDDAVLCDRAGTRWINSRPQIVAISARDSDEGNQAEPGAGVAEIGLRLPGGESEFKLAEIECDLSGAQPACPDYALRIFSYRVPATLAEGVHQAWTRAKDPDGRASEAAVFKLGVDHTQPTLAGGLGDFSVQRGGTPQSHELVIDPADPLPDPSEPQSASGVRSIEVLIGPDNATEDQLERRRYWEIEPYCSAADCKKRAFTFDARHFQTGEYDTVIRVEDGAGNITERRINATATLLTGADPARQGPNLGLEQFFHYDSIEAGLAGIHTNLATGNVVYHKVPIANPGRGLASVVNLTYNSFELPRFGAGIPTQDPANSFTPIGVEERYNQAGFGFSISASGLGRINEPLLGVAPIVPAIENQPEQITLIDADGTRHLFTRNDERALDQPRAYDPPPGVNLRLRRFSPYNLLALPETDTKAWAITRPDGVTFFYDGWGFMTSIVDRDGNTTRYEYESYLPATGTSCAGVPIFPGVCEPRLVRIVDPAGVADPGLANARSLEISYHPGGVVPPASTTGPTGKIAVIRDHRLLGGQKRELRFDYNDAGYLQTLTEAAGSAEARSTSFTYDAWNYPSYGQMTAVTDPRGETTELSYEPAADAAPRRVETIINRSGGERSYAYLDASASTPITEAQQDDRSLRSAARVVDELGNPWITKLDEADRPIALIDPLAGGAGRTTTLAWDADNNVTKLVEAAGSPDAATSAFAYDQNGMLTAQTDAVGRTTRLSYCQSAGVVHSTSGIDDQADDTFVSDLVEIQRPAGNSYAYELDGLARALPPALEPADAYCSQLRSRGGALNSSAQIQGRVSAEIDPLGVRAETTYDDGLGDGPDPDTVADGPGLISAEVVDPGGLDLRTEYRSYDPSGLPTEIISPEGLDDDGEAATTHRWLYGYDEVGNLETMADPRGSAGFGPENLPGPSGDFTTTLSYDSHDRLSSERVPRDTKNAADEFLISSHAYDANNNLISETDAANATTDLAYTPMDRLERELSPAVEVRESVGGPITSERLQSLYCYDDREQLVASIRPEAAKVLPENPASSEVDTLCADETLAHSTSYRLDPLGRPLAEIAGHSNADKRLVTSYAYDLRDNQTNVIDPRRNETRTIDAAISAAASGDDPRITNTYSPTDNLLRTIEDPDGLDLRTEYRYDENDNLTLLTSPRGFKATDAADPGDHTSIYLYDERDMPTNVIDPTGGRTRMAYDNAGRLIEETGPRGSQSGLDLDDTVDYSYDDEGRLLSRSIPWIEGQYGIINTAALDGVKVEYERDQLGDPITITDPRGTRIRNSFYDSGELRTTNRPWWFRLDWSSPYGSPGGGNRYVDAPGGLGPDFAIPPGGPMLAEGGIAPDGGTQSGSAAMSGDFGTVNAEHLPDMLPRAGCSSFSYDPVGRLKAVSPGTQKQTPADGCNPEAIEWKIAYDKLGRVEKKIWPYGTQQDAAPEIVHSFAYDRDSNLASFTDGVGNQQNVPQALLSKLRGGWGAGNPNEPSLVKDAYSHYFTYDAFERMSTRQAPGSLSDPDDIGIAHEVTEWAYDPNGNVALRTTPRGPAFGYSFDYDNVDRLQSELAPDGATFSYSYDAESNITDVADPRSNLTETAYDAMSRPTSITEAAGSAVERTTTLERDSAGNVVRITAPGAGAHPTDPIRERITEVSYDGLGQQWRSTTGVGGINDLNETRTSLIQRDQAGNPVRVVNPIALDGSDEAAVLAAFDPYATSDPNPERIPADPFEEPAPGSGGGQALKAATVDATVNRFDADGLRRSSYLPHSGAAGERRYRINMTYDDRGRLRSLDNAYDFTATPITKPNGSPDYNAAGFDPQAFTTRVSYNYFETDWIRSSSDRREVDPAVGKPLADQSLRYAYDRRGIQTAWVTAAYRQDRAGGRLISRLPNPSGTLYRRTGFKLDIVPAEIEADFDPDSGIDDASRRPYSYYYNPNRSLIEMVDRIPDFPGAPATLEPTRRTTISRDPLERERKINEDWRSGRDTAFSYDASGNMSERATDGIFKKPDGSLCEPGSQDCTYQGVDRKLTSFGDYDALDRETTMTVSLPGTAEPDRTQTTAWWPSDELKQRTKLNGTVENRFYLRSGDLRIRVRDPESGGDETQSYEYDLNGNRLFDERGIHTYNARDQLTSWERPSGPQTSGTPSSPSYRSYAKNPADYPETGTTNYTLDGTGQRLEVTESIDHDQDLVDANGNVTGTTPINLDTTVAYDYRDGLLDHVRAKTQTTFAERPPADDAKIVTDSYYERYDDLGNVREIRTIETKTAPGDPDPSPQPGTEPASVPGCGSEIDRWQDNTQSILQNTTFHCYDEFGRLVASQAPDERAGLSNSPGQQPGSGAGGYEPEDSDSWIYDGLDRRDARITDPGPNGTGPLRVAERSYVGTSELLASENTSEGTDIKLRSYDYDSQGLRIGTQKRQSTGAWEPKVYDHDANGSVLGLEADDGSIGTSEYLYDPYGNAVDPEPGNATAIEDELPVAAQDNPFRFEGFYYDSGISSYDMQARQYRPDVGRFLGQDRFQAAGADLLLQSDPLTQNRYAFAGGNPVSNVEWDGHFATTGDGTGDDQAQQGYGGSVYVRGVGTYPADGGFIPEIGDSAQSPTADREALEAQAQAVINLDAGFTGAVSAYDGDLDALGDDDLERIIALSDELKAAKEEARDCDVGCMLEGAYTGMAPILGDPLGNEVDAATTFGCFVPLVRLACKVAGEVVTKVGGKLFGGGAHVAGESVSVGLSQTLRSLDDLGSLAGAELDEVRALVPDTWTELPLKTGEGTRFLNPERPGEAIMLEYGWPDATDLLHQGPYARISRGGEVHRIPLAGNPVLGG